MASALAGGMVAGGEVGPIQRTGGQMERARHPSAAHSTRPDPELAGSDSVLPGGLAIAQGGFRLQPQSTVASGTSGDLFRFRLLGPDGSDVAAFQDRPETELGVVVVSRELDSYYRLSSTRELDGSWAVALPDLAAGAYRVYTDFAPVGGPDLILGTDVMVPGDTQFDPLPPASSVVGVDGYEVTLEGTVMPAAPGELRFTVTQAGLPVEDLPAGPGSRGLVTAVRVGDLAATRADPIDGTTGSGGAAVFTLAVPSPGDYRLFYEFARGDQTHVAAFSVAVPAAHTGHPMEGE